MLPISSHLLIIDDFATMRKILKKQLLQLGYTKISEAESAAKGLNLLKSSADSGAPIQAILCDWNLPEESGLDLLRLCRKDPQLKRIPFMIVTGESSPEQLALVHKASPDSLLLKPFNLASLKRCLGELHKNSVPQAS